MTDEEAMEAIERATQKQFYDDHKELQRYRKREPSVRALMDELTADADGASWPSMEAVRDFKIEG